MVSRDFIARTLTVLGLAALVFVLWRVSYALLLGFGGVLFAVFLRGLAARLCQWTGLGVRAALAAVVFALVLALALSVALVGPAVVERADELGSTAARGLEQVHERLEQSTWGRRLLEALSQGVESSGNLLGAAGRILFSAVDALFALALVVVAGLYLAARPREYTEGAVYLVPKARHARMREVLDATGDALWLWIVGQFIIMAVVGALTALGLLIAGVPLAVPLGVLAGLLEFIPFLGPFIAAVPILLVAFTASPATALWALVVLVVIQQIESNALAPLIARWAVSLPPVLSLVGAIGFSLLLGVLGLILAAPLLVVAMVWTKMLYEQDALEERVSVPGKA